jgi:Arc/MetJ-type ribon-helix-helix transcriptional regulator
MAVTKRKALVNAEPDHLAEVEALIQQGRYRTLSDFVRQAMEEKLARLRREKLAEQVERYCDEVDQREDGELIAWQAFPEVRSSARRTRRAKR